MIFSIGAGLADLLGGLGGEAGLAGLGSLLGIGEAAAAPAEAAGAAALPALTGAGFAGPVIGIDVPLAAGAGAGGLGAAGEAALGGAAGLGGGLLGDFAASMVGPGTAATNPFAMGVPGATGAAAGPGVLGATPTFAPPTQVAAAPASPLGGPGGSAAGLAGDPSIAATDPNAALTSGAAMPKSIGGVSGADIMGAAPTPPADVGAASTGAAPVPVKAGGGLMDWASQNKGLLTTLGAGVGGTLAAPALSGLINKVPQQGALTGLAGQEAGLAAQQQALGQTLTSPLVTGNLPPEAAQAVTNATNDAISTVKARYASLGLTGSTMEADAISNIQNQKSALTFQIAQQMAQTGEAAIGQAAGAMGLQDQIYAQLMNAQISQDTALQQAIARMAAGAALGAGTSSATKTAAGAANVFGG